jgi:hypothetical protein
MIEVMLNLKESCKQDDGFYHFFDNNIEITTLTKKVSFHLENISDVKYYEAAFEQAENFTIIGR